MRFSVATVLAFAASAFAAVGTDPTPGFDSVHTPATNQELQAGKPFTVEWTAPAPYTDGEIFIQLLSGPSSDKLQVKVEKLATLNNNAGKYVWDVDAALGDSPLYGLRFVWGADNAIIQYSNQFKIKKAEGASGSSTVTVTSSQGVKTITLSTTTSSTTSTSTTTTTTTHNTTTSAYNSTTITSVTKTSSQPSSTASATTTQTTVPAKPSSAAAHLAGSVAAVGGLVAALLAL